MCIHFHLDDLSSSKCWAVSFLVRSLLCQCNYIVYRVISVNPFYACVIILYTGLLV